MERLASYQPIRTTFPTLIKIASYIPLPMLRESAQAGKRIGMYAAQSIDRYRRLMAQNPSDPKPTLLTKLFDTEKNGLSFQDIRQEAQGYIVAGSDTTAVTMTYLSYAVSNDSRVREKLVAELMGLAEPITDKSLRNLPYLNQVITETLRLYTAVPLGLPRAVPPEGAHFCGFQIPGGITVSTQSYSLHRDPSIFPDPYR
jgi:cytochrome P450